MPYVEPLSQYVACAIVPWCVLKSAPANVTYRMPRGPGATAAAATPWRAPTIPTAAEAMAVPLSSVRRSIAFPFLPRARTAGYARSLEESQPAPLLDPDLLGQPPAHDARRSEERDPSRRCPGDRRDCRRVEVRARRVRVQEEEHEHHVARPVDPPPQLVVHPPTQPARHRDDHEEIERERSEADLQRAVGDLERHHDVERVDLRGLVEQQRDDVSRPEGDPEPRRPVVERPQRTVLREPVEHRGAQRDPRQDRDAEGGVRRHPGGARDEPDEELRIHPREAIAGAGGGAPQPQETCVSVTAGSVVAWTPGWRLRKGAGVEGGRVRLPRTPTSGGSGVGETPAGGVRGPEPPSTGGCSGAAAFLRCSFA